MLIIQENANIDQLPEVDKEHPADIKNQLTIGDLHANPLKLIYFLVRQNVFNIKRENYAEIVRIYKIPTAELTKEDLELYAYHLDNIEVNPVGTVRFIGDTIVDRGMNDIYILKLYELLKKKNVPVEFLLSNHDNEFVEACEKQDHFFPPRLSTQYGSSAYELQKLVNKGIVTKEEVYRIADTCYKPYFRVLSYTLSEDKNKISIFSHAGIGLRVIQLLAGKFNVKFNDSTAEELARTIDRINIVFQQHVKNKTVHTLYSTEAMARGYAGEEIDPEQFPLEYIVWNRFYGKLDRPEQHPNGYDIDFIHGHDLKDTTEKNIYNLDNELGKAPDKHIGKYHIIYSQETPAPRNIHELSQAQLAVPDVAYPVTGANNTLFSKTKRQEDEETTAQKEAKVTEAATHPTVAQGFLKQG